MGASGSTSVRRKRSSQASQLRARPTTTSPTPRAQRVAALYDVHGNPAALEAVLAEAGDATLVFGGDYAWGPFPAETVDRIRLLDALAIRGNADRDPGDDWTVEQLGAERFEWLQSLPEQVELDVEGVGRVLFCHGSPRSDEEIILRTTPDEWLREMVADVDADVVVCGHTHMQFDREADGIRVVNAGSVGLAYGAPGAHWLALGPGVEHRRTHYDNEAFADRVATLSWPIAARFAEESIRNTRTEDATLEFFEAMAGEQRGQRYPGRS